MSNSTRNPLQTEFKGFSTPRQNWFKMPHDWIDLCADISSVAEIKVVQYVMRHTWGHQEYGIRKRISLDEFMNGRRRKDGSRMDKGTGLSKPSVISGLRSAVERGLLIEETDDSDKARVKKYYSLRMVNQTQALSEEFIAEDDDQGEIKDLNADVKNFYPTVKSFVPRSKKTLHRTEKDTLDKYTEKENYNNSDEQDKKLAVVADLVSFGIAQKVSETLAQGYPPEYVREKISFLRFKLEREKDSVKKPAAWLRSAIEDDYNAPEGYLSREKREMQQDDEKRRKQAILEAQKAHLERIEQQQNEQYQQRSTVLARMFKRFGTGQSEFDQWSRVQPELVSAGVPATVAGSLQLLQVTQDEVVLYVANHFMWQRVTEPTINRIIETVFARVLDRQVRLKLVTPESESESHETG